MLPAERVIIWSTFVSYTLFNLFFVSLNMSSKNRARHDINSNKKGVAKTGYKALPALCLLLIASALCLSCTAHAQTPSPTQADNTSPVIRYLTANELTSAKQVKPSAGLEIICTATDIDNDTLYYSWSASGGKIEGQGERILWVSPEDEGSYTVEVIVDDGRGGSISKAIDLTVTAEPSTPPVVTGMYCIDCVNAMEASRWSTYEIKCDASDPENGELHYLWFATTGKIEGNGPTATWITKGQYGNALITVIVTDADGNETEGYLAINISCCH